MFFYICLTEANMARPRVVVSFKTEIEIKEIINEVCQCLSLNVEDVLWVRRKRKFVDARYIIVEKIRSRFEDVPYEYISMLFNRKTHIYAFQAEMRCKELLKVNNQFREKYNCNKLWNTCE